MTSLKTLLGVLCLGLAPALSVTATGAVAAQDESAVPDSLPEYGTPEDPNARTPQILTVDGQTEAGEPLQLDYIVGEGAWGDVLALVTQIRSNDDPAQNEAIAQELWASRDLNPPIFLFEYARRMVDVDPDAALYGYLLARSRTIYDVDRCLDSTAAPSLMQAVIFGEEAEALMEDYGRLEAQLSALYSSGEAFTGQHSPWWICSTAQSVYFAALEGDTLSGQEWLKSSTRWGRAQDLVNQNLQESIALARAAQAVEGMDEE